MTSTFVGRSASSTATFSGRDVLGILTEETLSVSVNADLGVDADTDLDVSEGVVWTGATATQSIACEGMAVAIIEDASS